MPRIFRPPAAVFVALALAGCCACGSRSRSTPERIAIEPGPRSREPAIVRFVAPASWKSASAAALSDGSTVPAQHEADGTITVVLPRLDPGKPLSLSPAQLPARSQSAAPGRVADSKITLSDHLGASLNYQAEPGTLPRHDIAAHYRRGGYVQSLFSPSGLRVTDDFPVNHVHHHGVWSPWTKTRFEGREPDFWNMGDKKGRVDFVAVDATWSGPVHSGIRTRHDFIDMLARPEKTALHESWELRTYALPDPTLRITDLTLEQTCATASPLELPEYRYGGLGFRGHGSWNGATNCHFLTSEGITDRVKAHATRARWCWIGGLVDGRLTGVAILDHPENFRAPQPMRIHPDEPFFCYAPPLLGDFKIVPGQPYRARYRLVTFDGPPDAARINRLWDDFATPAGASHSRRAAASL